MLRLVCVSACLVASALLVGCAAEDAGSPGPDEEEEDSTSPDASGGKTDDPAAGKIIFVTSSRHDGDLGGPDGADEICAGVAEAAGLEGTFRAWLSTPTASASERLTMSTDPYYRTDGALIADDWADLIDANIAAPINRDELGNSQFGDVWTGTFSSGVTAPESCSGFMTTSGSGLCGNSGATTLQWTDNLVPGCTTQLRLYCIEQ